MALKHLDDPAAIRAAVDEFDRLGRSAFLDKYGFGKARGYFLRIGDKRYDAKAIAGAGHGYQFPSVGPLLASAFSDGAATMKCILEKMGFEFVLQRADVPAQAEAELEADSDEASGAFGPANLEDARKKTFAAIVMRQGQPAFRQALLKAYENRCALTNCDIVDVLEAAHISRYMGTEPMWFRTAFCCAPICTRSTTAR